MADPGVFERFSLENFPNCFKEYADILDWYEYWHTTLDTSDAPCWKWFAGGKINASYNCVDRHLAKNKNKTAIHFVPELEEEKIEHITYQELYVRVNEFAALLRDFAGLKAGDRVTLHMPMSAELPITMLACARLGVIHSEVFGGFSGRASADRIVDSQSRVLIIMDSYYRAGKLLNHKENADIAVDLAEKDGQKVDKVLVWQRYPGKASSPTPMVEGRDYFINEVLKEYYGRRVDPVPMPAEAPLFLMYTSGTTGQAQRLPAQHRRVSCLCRRNVQIRPGYPSGRCLLVHGRYRLDHRTFLHRLRAAGAVRLNGYLRRRSQLSGPRPTLADRPGTGCEHFSHRAHRLSVPCAKSVRTSRPSIITILST